MTEVPELVRKIVYLLTAIFAAVYVVAEANVEIHWGWMAAYAGWNAMAGVLAASNVNTPL